MNSSGEQPADSMKARASSAGVALRPSPEDQEFVSRASRHIDLGPPSPAMKKRPLGVRYSFVLCHPKSDLFWVGEGRKVMTVALSVSYTRPSMTRFIAYLSMYVWKRPSRSATRPWLDLGLSLHPGQLGASTPWLASVGIDSSRVRT